ncbi:MAG: RNA polymerase sigma factor [Cytophaga sp.]|uniref:RNA polymerase sigma factor n=1 Tax=Cytophaga sp. TaxID=29535 RepID=UPI003F7FF86F
MNVEKDLIEGCKKGKHKSFESLYQLYAGRLLSIAMRYAFTTFEAEDILQDAFIKIFNSIHTYEYKGSFEGWLKRIVVTTAINHYHKDKFKQTQTDYVEVEEESDDVADIISKISADELLETIQTLPDGYRMVFNMYVVEGYTHKEIGELLCISEGTSKSQLAKGRTLLKNKLLQKGVITL